MSGKIDEKDIALHLQADDRVIELMTACGSDMSEPHELEHFIHAPDLKVANAVVAEAQAAGYKTADPAFCSFQGLDYWLVMTFSPAVPKADNVHHETMFMRALATKHGAEYDGWGTGLIGDDVSLDGLEDV